MLLLLLERRFHTPRPSRHTSRPLPLQHDPSRHGSQMSGALWITRAENRTGEPPRATRAISEGVPRLRGRLIEGSSLAI